MTILNERAKKIQELNDDDDIYKDLRYQQMNEEYYTQTQPTMSPPERQYHKEKDFNGFGDSRDPTKLAKEIERNPTPHGIGRIMIGGRPIDLHMFEDYMVWKVSPYQLRTVLRYRNARIMEEIKNYSSVPIVKLKMGNIILIIAAAGLGLLGFLIITMMPQITAFFKGII